MEYPDLLNVRVEEQVAPEQPGGEPTTRVVNPLLSLIETSSLEGDALRAQMAQLAKFYSGSSAAPAASAATQEPPANPPTVPTPATPLEEDTVEFWQQKLIDASARVIAGDSAAKAERRLAGDKIRELKRQRTT